MDNPKYIQVMRQVASDFDGISHELFQVASDLERMDQYNPQQKLFSLVRSAEVSSVTLRNLTARTVRDDTAPFYCEVADLLGLRSRRLMIGSRSQFPRFFRKGIREIIKHF